MSISPEDFINAVLAIVADPKAAQRRLDDHAELEEAKKDLAKREAALAARSNELRDRHDRLNGVDAKQQQERERLVAQEASLVNRSNILTAGENELQGKIVAHGQASQRRDAELNTREQAVAKREIAVEGRESKVAADRELLDKKLAKAREFVDAA